MFGGSFTQLVVAKAAVLLTRRKPNTSAEARRLGLNRIVTPLFGHASREKGVVRGRHRPHDARVPQTPCRAPLAPVTMSHASVASRLERGECSLSTSPFIRTHALRKARARAGASCWRSRLRSNPSEPRSLRQAEQVAVRASETAVGGAQEQRRSARNRDSRGTEKVGCSCKGYGAHTMALLP